MLQYTSLYPFQVLTNVCSNETKRDMESKGTHATHIFPLSQTAYAVSFKLTVIKYSEETDHWARIAF
jgi:hypothetical protein